MTEISHLYTVGHQHNFLLGVNELANTFSMMNKRKEEWNKWSNEVTLLYRDNQSIVKVKTQCYPCFTSILYLTRNNKSCI